MSKIIDIEDGGYDHSIITDEEEEIIEEFLAEHWNDEDVTQVTIENGEVVAYKCYDKDPFAIGSACASCGGDYPNCADSCPIYGG